MFIRYGMHIELSLFCEMELVSSHLEAGKKALAVLVNSGLLPFVEFCHLPLVANVWNIHHTAATVQRNPWACSKVHGWNQQTSHYKYAKHIISALWSIALMGERMKWRLAWELGFAVVSLQECQKRATKTEAFATQTEGWVPDFDVPVSPIVPIKI